MQENILVVDDNDDIRSNVAEYLRAKGWKAEEANWSYGSRSGAHGSL